MARVFQKCFKSVAKVFQSVSKGCQKRLKALQKRYKSVTKALQKRYKSFSERFECASNVFQSVSRVLCYVHSICCIPYGVLEHLFFDTPLQRNACFSLLGTVVQLCRCIMAGLPSWVNEHPVSTQWAPDEHPVSTKWAPSEHQVSTKWAPSEHPVSTRWVDHGTWQASGSKNVKNAFVRAARWCSMVMLVYAHQNLVCHSAADSVCEQHVVGYSINLNIVYGPAQINCDECELAKSPPPWLRTTSRTSRSNSLHAGRSSGVHGHITFQWNETWDQEAAPTKFSKSKVLSMPWCLNTVVWVCGGSSIMFHNEINCLTQTINFIMEHYGTASTINCIVRRQLHNVL